MLNRLPPDIIRILLLTNIELLYPLSLVSRRILSSIKQIPITRLIFLRARRLIPQFRIMERWGFNLRILMFENRPHSVVSNGWWSVNVYKYNEEVYMTGGIVYNHYRSGFEWNGELTCVKKYTNHNSIERIISAELRVKLCTVSDMMKSNVIVFG